MILFQVFDPIWNALSDGVLFRNMAARILVVFAWMGAAASGLALLLTLATSLTGLSGNALAGVFLSALCTSASLYVNACIMAYRSRKIQELPESPRMISWVLVHLLRMAGEQTAVSLLFFGGSLFFSMSLMSAGLGRMGMGYGLPGLSGGGIIGGFVTLVMFGLFAAGAYVVFALMAELLSSFVESADVLRALDPRPTVAAVRTPVQQPVAQPAYFHCPRCQTVLPVGSPFCGTCGTRLG